MYNSLTNALPVFAVPGLPDPLTPTCAPLLKTQGAAVCEASPPLISKLGLRNRLTAYARTCVMLAASRQTATSAVDVASARRRSATLRLIAPIIGPHPVTPAPGASRDVNGRLIPFACTPRARLERKWGPCVPSAFDGAVPSAPQSDEPGSERGRSPTGPR